MIAFQVQDCKNGPGKNPWVKVTAQSAQEAAEKVCGEKLRNRGKPGELRARVVRTRRRRRANNCLMQRNKDHGDLARKEIAFYADVMCPT
jgi:hypothetical protein